MNGLESTGSAAVLKYMSTPFGEYYDKIHKPYYPPIKAAVNLQHSLLEQAVCFDYIVTDTQVAAAMAMLKIKATRDLQMMGTLTTK